MSPDSDSHPDYVSVEEFAARVGFSVPTLRRRIKEGAIHIWQPGGPGTRLSIPLSELNRLRDTKSKVSSPKEESPRSPAAKPLSGRMPAWKQHLKGQRK